MLEDLIERCQDRYDGARFSSLLGRAVSLANVQMLDGLLLKLSDSEEVLLPGLDVLTLFLTFYKADKLKQGRKNNNNDNSDFK